MDPSGRRGGGSNAAAEGENCLKEIANNYVEEGEGDESSGEDAGGGRENGVGFSTHVGHGRGGRRGVVGNGTGTEECGDSADDSGDGSGRMEVSSGSSGEGHSGESSAEEEEAEVREQSQGTSGGGSGGMEGTENGFVENEHEGGSYSGDAKEGSDDAGGAENGLGVRERGEDGPSLRKRRGRPLKASERRLGVRAAPITPKLEEPRAVRVNRGVKRRFLDAGDESEDSLPKRIRVRSIASVCGDVSQSVKEEDLSMEEESLEVTLARKRGRPRKGVEGGQGVVGTDEAEVSPLGESGKRKMVEAVLDADTLKRPCHGKNGTIFACNAVGCKKRFTEAAALYAHARVHGDRPYVCHYDGCTKSFSERSKLKRHFLIHTGEKPFLCLYEGCGKAFSLDFNLRSHMKTHTGEYNECPYEGCDKRYCQEYKLRAHIAKEHAKPAKGAKKLAKVVGNDVRGTNGWRARDAAAAKKREVLSALMAKRSRLESKREERVSIINALEEAKQREASELARIEQDLKRLERAQRQVEEGRAGSPAVSLSEEEDADDEEEEEEEEEEASPSNGTGGDTSSSGEQQSRLEYTAMGEGRDVIMFAHKLPTADQGARLVKPLDARAPESQQEATTSLTPLLWLQGPPPHHGHLAQHSALRPFLRSRRPGGPGVERPARALRPCSSLDERERAGGESSESGLGKVNGAEKGAVEGPGKARAGTGKRNPGTGGHGGGKANANSEKDGENGRMERKAQKRERENQARAGKQQQSGRAASSEPVFVNPILLSSDHRFSPTDARFLSNQESPSMAQAMLRDRLSKEAVRSAPGQASVPKEKVYRSMNEVLHSSTNEQQQGYSACSGLNEGFGGEQGPSEQSFEPSAAQLFTYHEQSRLVD